MELITFDDRKVVGRIEGDTAVDLDARDMRDYFECSGAVRSTGRELVFAGVQPRAPIIPKSSSTAGNFQPQEEPKNVDITARDIQQEDMKSGVFCVSKSIDTLLGLLNNPTDYGN